MYHQLKGEPRLISRDLPKHPRGHGDKRFKSPTVDRLTAVGEPHFVERPEDVLVG